MLAHGLDAWLRKRAKKDLTAGNLKGDEIGRPSKQMQAALAEERERKAAAEAEVQRVVAKAYAEKDPELSDREIAERCGKGVSWVQAWRKANGLPAHSPHINAEPERTARCKLNKAKREAYARALREVFPEAQE